MEITSLKDLKIALNNFDDEILDQFYFQLNPEGSTDDTFKILAAADDDGFVQVWEDARSSSPVLDDIDLFFNNLFLAQKILDQHEESAWDYFTEYPEPISTKTELVIINEGLRCGMAPMNIRRSIDDEVYQAEMIMDFDTLEFSEFTKKHPGMPKVGAAAQSMVNLLSEHNEQQRKGRG